RVLKQTLAARCQAELQQELSLRHRAMGSQSGRASLSFEIGEIDMGGGVGCSGIGKGIGEAMAAHALQRVAEAGLLVTVINDEGGKRRSLGTAPKLAHERMRRRPRFQDRVLVR